MSYTENLGIEFVSATPERVEAVMPITSDLHQPFGFLHGGVTLALLESVASKGAELRTDFARERPFGIGITARHRKSARSGMLRGVAELDRVEGSKQIWRIAAYDEAGDVVSDGEFTTKIVTLDRLREKGVEV